MAHSYLTADQYNQRLSAWNYYRKEMDEEQKNELSCEDKRLLHLLQLKIYDISQNVELVGRQLTNNQIKDIIANSYNIFCQLRKLFQKAQVGYLYDIVRKMQINSVVMSSLLAERMDKKNAQKAIVNKIEETQKVSITAQSNVQERKAEVGKVKPHRLGGISLYNQAYMRGLEYFEVTNVENLEQLVGKCRLKQSKKSKQDFLTSISQQIDSKAEVEIQNISQQIKKYIKDYKQNTKINNFVSYQKQLIEILDFFKTSELQAMSFLNKSPKNQDYTEDYINRMNELQNQFKNKEKSQKLTVKQKLHFFIMNLKQRIRVLQQNHEQKQRKLYQYQKSLKKQTISISTQTYDNYQSKMKQQQSIIRDLQQRYIILSQLKNKQVSFQSKYYQALHDLNFKNNQINKHKTLNSDLQQEIAFLKKVIRDNKEKIGVDLRDLQKKRGKRKLLTDTAKSQNQLAEGNQRVSVDTNKNDNEVRSSRLQRKTKKIERAGTQNSAFYKNSQFTQLRKESQMVRGEQEIQKKDEIFGEVKQRVDTSNTDKLETIKKNVVAQVYQREQQKQSFFKNQHKKNSKKVSEREKQVLFAEEPPKKSNQVQQTQQIPNSQVADWNISIDHIRNEEQLLENSRKSNKKNTLRQVIQSSHGYSMKSVEGQQKKSSKSISKKCIILKDNKQKDKSTIATAIKLDKFVIKDVYNLTVYPSIEFGVRRQRPSLPFANNQLYKNINSPHSSVKLKSIASKTKLNQTTHNMPKLKAAEERKKGNKGERGEKVQKIQGLLKQNLSKKSLSRKQNQSNSSLSKVQIGIEDEKSKLPQSKIRTKQQQFLKNKSSISNGYKRLAEIGKYLQKLQGNKKKISITDEVNQEEERWKDNSFNHSQRSSLAHYLLQNLQKSEISSEEFQEIINIIEKNGLLEEQEAQQHPQVKNQQQPRISETKSNVMKINRLSINKKEQLNAIKSQTQQDKRRLPSIREYIYQQIKQMHLRLGKCSRNGKPCEHLAKYYDIFKKNNVYVANRNSLRIHIQKIGQSAQQPSFHLQKPSLREIKSLQKQQLQHSKPLKSSYIKSNQPSIDYSMQIQRQRILPVISTTGSNYYKPKSKQFTVK